MTLALTLGLGLLIGAVLGSLGGGGAILTVPVLSFALGQTAQQATTGSLIIVGVTATFGAITLGRVRWRLGAAFGAVGIVAAFFGSALNRQVDPRILLLGFAGVMLLAATGLLLDARVHPEPPVAAPVATPAGRVAIATTEVHSRTRRWVHIVVTGTGVGFLTGFFGVGGGFVVVPALVLGLGLPVRLAAGTSLLIVAINSGAALLARSGDLQVDWRVIAPFTLAALLGTVLGKRSSDRLSATTLARGFAGLLVMVAGYVIFQTW